MGFVLSILEGREWKKNCERGEGAWGNDGPTGNFLKNPRHSQFLRVLIIPKITIRLKNQSCRPSPVVWGKHRSKWSTRLGSWFFRPHFQIGLSKFCRNKSAQLVIPKSQGKHGNLKKCPVQIAPHLLWWTEHIFRILPPTQYFCTPKVSVTCGIWTHARRLRPEHSALDRSAKVTSYCTRGKILLSCL